jgi:diguanylate cyclase (GGDEF)-like protein
MVVVMAAIAAVTVTSLIQNSANVDTATRSVKTSDAYWSALNSAVDAGLLASQLKTADDAATREKLAQSLLAAFQATSDIKKYGTARDRQIIADLEQRFAVPMEMALQFLASPQQSSLPLSSSDTATLLAQVRDALTEPAAQSREYALTELSSLRHTSETRSIGIIIALVLGFPAIEAGAMAVRYYERRNAARETELQKLREAALMDSITGLGNHRAFHEELQREWSHSARHDSTLTLAFADLDDFKQTNDTYGHAYGDTVLAEFASLLKLVLPDVRAFRVGGDEFALLIADRQDEDFISDLNRIPPLLKAGLDGTTVSFGLCSSRDATDATALRHRADVALYAAKRRGKDQIVVYEESLDQERREAAARAAELDRILSTRNIRVVFQPIYNFRELRIIACEALARLPDSPLAGPADAFAVADIVGNSWMLDRLCLEAALEAAESLPGGIKLFLNLDPNSLRDPRFSAAQVGDMARNHGIRPEQVVLELTEQSAVAGETLSYHLTALRDEGFGLALDDVGAGNAGLELLRSHHFDYVKIDRTVVESASRQGTNGKAVLLAIMAFAAESGARVIAEGVEVEESARMLQAAGSSPNLVVEAVQGFLLSQPLPSMNALLSEVGKKAA